TTPGRNPILIVSSCAMAAPRPRARAETATAVPMSDALRIHVSSHLLFCAIRMGECLLREPDDTLPRRVRQSGGARGGDPTARPQAWSQDQLYSRRFGRRPWAPAFAGG